MSMQDDVNNPKHYQSSTGLEAIDVIEAFDLGFRLGNAIKYILRHGRKDDAVKDLQKARWYLDREIATRTTPMPKTIKDVNGKTKWTMITLAELMASPTDFIDCRLVTVTDRKAETSGKCCTWYLGNDADLANHKDCLPKAIFDYLDGSDDHGDWKSYQDEASAHEALSNACLMYAKSQGAAKTHPLRHDGESDEAFEARMKDPDSWGK